MDWHIRVCQCMYSLVPSSNSQRQCWERAEKIEGAWGPGLDACLLLNWDTHTFEYQFTVHRIAHLHNLSKFFLHLSVTGWLGAEEIGCVYIKRGLIFRVIHYCFNSRVTNNHSDIDAPIWRLIRVYSHHNRHSNEKFTKKARVTVQYCSIRHDEWLCMCSDYEEPLLSLQYTGSRVRIGEDSLWTT